MKVLGLKIGGHDPGAALVINGKTKGDTKVLAIAEERLSRVKHAPHDFPTRSIKYVLEGLKVKPSELDLVVYDTTVDEVRFSKEEELEAWVREHMPEGFESVRFVGALHHEAHAATAFYCSPYEEAAVLVYDGGGAVTKSSQGGSVIESESFYKGKGNKLTIVHKTHYSAPESGGFPYSYGIGRLYSKLSSWYIAFGPHNDGKMMGLAAYGDDSFLKQFPYERWVARHNGELICNAQLTYPTRSVAAFTKRSGDLNTLVRDIRNGLLSRGKRLRNRIRTAIKKTVSEDMVYPSVFEPIRLPKPVRDAKNDKLPDAYYSSVAYAAQKIFERFAIDIGTYLRDITGSDTICVAGGCALNIDANRNFMTEVGFKNIFVQPASSDCGIALGCALWGMHAVLDQPRHWVMRSASLGKPYTMDEVTKALEDRADELEWHVSKDTPKEVAALIAKGSIIGWHQGGSEYGPRALGNRSILCDASNPDMRDILNSRVKHREMWRPFAAAVLRDKMDEWFDLDVESPFMLLTGIVHEEKRKKVPSIVHVDGTCRLQSLTAEDNGPYFKLVDEFNKLTGVPLILNTSFNLGGDPIVETPADAIDTFLRTDMDYLVLEDAIIKKRVPDSAR